MHCVVVNAVCVCICVGVCECVHDCVCVCVRVGWCICIHNCLASCWTPIQCSIPPRLEGGEVFCYADTIDGNCQPAKNVCVAASMCQNFSLCTHLQWPRVQKSPTGSLRCDSHGKLVVHVDSHLENNANQVSTVFLANTCLNYARSPSTLLR